jgi:hypothetical protein
MDVASPPSFSHREGKFSKQKGRTPEEVRPFQLFENYLRVGTRMDQPSHAIGKQHVNLSRLDQGRNFASAPNRMAHRLAGSICAFHVVRFAVF